MPRNSQIIHHQEFANALQDDVQFDLDSGTISYADGPLTTGRVVRFNKSLKSFYLCSRTKAQCLNALTRALLLT